MTQGQKRSKKKEEPTMLEMCFSPYVDMYRMSRRVINKAGKSLRRAREARR